LWRFVPFTTELMGVRMLGFPLFHNATEEAVILYQRNRTQPSNTS